MEEKKTFDEEPQGDQFGEPIHIFPVQGGGMFWVLESQLPTEEQEPEHVVFSEERTQPPSNQMPQGAPAAPRIGVRIPSLVLLVNISVSLMVFLLTSLQTVTIIITPKSQHITAHLTLATLQSRVFSPLTVTQRKTVPATGKGYQEATEAEGEVTFYNASPQEQSIESGTLLIGADGVQVVTNQTAYLPASTPPTETQFTVPAHALNAGKAGNIHAGDITGACCKAGVYVESSAFSGGQDSRTYSTVTKQDIQSVLSSLQPAMEQTINATFAKQMHATETLTPLYCSQTIIPSNQPGDEAETVTVTVKKACLAGAYTANSLQAAIVQALAQKEPGYQPTAYLQISPFQATLRTGQVILAATYQATMLYHFSQEETHALVRELKGKQRKQALQLLSSLPGVARIAITTPANQEVLPTDTVYIHLVFVPS